MQAPTDEHRLSITTDSTNQAIVLCPVSVRLTNLFLQIDDTFKSKIHGCDFKDHAFECEDNKEVKTLLKAGAIIVENSNPGSNEWCKLFSQAFGEHQKDFSHNPKGVEMRDFCFDLAANDPLSLSGPRKWTWKATSMIALSHLRGSRLP